MGDAPLRPRRRCRSCLCYKNRRCHQAPLPPSCERSGCGGRCRMQGCRGRVGGGWREAQCRIAVRLRHELLLSYTCGGAVRPPPHGAGGGRRPSACAARLAAATRDHWPPSPSRKTLSPRRRCGSCLCYKNRRRRCGGHCTQAPSPAAAGGAAGCPHGAPPTSRYTSRGPGRSRRSSAAWARACGTRCGVVFQPGQFNPLWNASVSWHTSHAQMTNAAANATGPVAAAPPPPTRPHRRILSPSRGPPSPLLPGPRAPSPSRPPPPSYRSCPRRCHL